ncbi:hypothetical protein E2C01_063496 [Portunus trituberculatus]|uniref:Uncharacterized protein n=1 Tax=Portunus trituberculatus TaxID=210409 RepID=A0A5B7HKM6_PORTR|nr:hypothetical protein [Portunus trituberculatus]
MQAKRMITLIYFSSFQLFCTKTHKCRQNA